LFFLSKKKVGDTTNAVKERRKTLNDRKAKAAFDLNRQRDQIKKYEELVQKFKELILRVNPYPPLAPELPKIVQIKRIEASRDYRYYLGLIELKATSEQEVLIINKGIMEITIADWKLVSHRQNQTLTFPAGCSILPFQRIAVVLVPEPKVGFNNGMIEWELDSWLPDDFALILFDRDGLLVADLHHLCGNTISGTSQNFNTFIDPTDMD